DEVPTNMALMAFLDSKVYNDKTYSKTCLKSFETLKTQLDDLRIEFNKSEFNLATYKRGLASVEEQLVFYKKNEVIFSDQIAVLKRDISYKDSEISVLKSEVEKLKQEKESNQLKIEKYDNDFKSLEKLIGSQITDNIRKGVGFVSYNVVPPTHTGLFSPPTLDLSNSGLEEFQKPEFEGYGPKTSKSVSVDIVNKVRESPDPSLVEELVSDDKLEKETAFPTKIEFVKAKQQEKPVRKPVQYAKMYRPKAVNTARPNSAVVNVVRANQGHPQKEDQSYVDSRFLRHMTGNMSYLLDLRNLREDMLPLGEEPKEGKLLVKELLKLVSLILRMYFVKELQFNLFSVSHMCDKKNSVLFTDTRCFVLSPDFKLADESQVLLKVPRKNNMYSVDMKNIVPKESLTCLVAKATLDESMLWHRRLGHVNFKTINKLVKENLVRGLPLKHFENDQTCVACLKGKQHKASIKLDVGIVEALIDCWKRFRFRNGFVAIFEGVVCGDRLSQLRMVPSYDDARNGNGEHNNSRMITTSELKISDEFLKILQENAFNGMDRGDVNDHIAKGIFPDTNPACRDIDNPDELCRTEEFTVVRHLIGNDEEFVTVGQSCWKGEERDDGKDSSARKADMLCWHVDFRTWPGISLEIAMISTMDLDGGTC
ncbi:ribonuclease H-like domain-containing protein, partial [Tanacetum coccineum]